MYLSAATNRITVTWGNYGKVCAMGRHTGLHREHRTALCSALPSSSPQSYSVGLYLVRQMTSAELLQRLKTIGIKHPELCKALGEYFWAGGAGGGSLYAHLVGIPGSQAARNVCES